MMMLNTRDVGLLPVRLLRLVQAILRPEIQLFGRLVSVDA
jgi:hypothetical protein